MKIVSIDAIPLGARLSAPFRFGHVVRVSSANVLVRAVTDDGITGWGEACPVPQLTAETQGSICAIIADRVTPVLAGADPLQWRPLLDQLQAQLTGCPATSTAVSTALLDLSGRALGTPVSTLLGGRRRDAVEVHGSIGWDENPQTVAARARDQASRYRMLKLYAGRGNLEGDLARIEAARDAVGGTGHPFLLDVNGLWTPLQALQAAPRLRDAGVVLVEQPVSPRDPAGMAEVTRCLGEHHGIDVAADESVRDTTSVLAVAAQRSARIINVGLSKLGGPHAAADTATVAAAAGLGAMVGSVVELGIATAAGLHLAASLPHLAYPSYLMGPLKYARQVSWPQPVPEDSNIAVPTGPGLGIEIDADAVAAMDLRRQ